MKKSRPKQKSKQKDPKNKRQFYLVKNIVTGESYVSTYIFGERTIDGVNFSPVLLAEVDECSGGWGPTVLVRDFFDAKKWRWLRSDSLKRV